MKNTVKSAKCIFVLERVSLLWLKVEDKSKKKVVISRIAFDILMITFK